MFCIVHLWTEFLTSSQLAQKIRPSDYGTLTTTRSTPDVQFLLADIQLAATSQKKSSSPAGQTEESVRSESIREKASGPSTTRTATESRRSASATTSSS